MADADPARTPAPPALDLDRAEQCLASRRPATPVESTRSWASPRSGRRGTTRRGDRLPPASPAGPAGDLRARIGAALTLPQVHAEGAEIDVLNPVCAGTRRPRSRGAGTRSSSTPRNVRAPCSGTTSTWPTRTRRPRASRLPSRGRAGDPRATSAQFYRRIAVKSGAAGGRNGFVSQFVYHGTAGDYFKKLDYEARSGALRNDCRSAAEPPDAVTAEIESAAARFRQKAFTFAGLRRRRAQKISTSSSIPSSA